MARIDTSRWKCFAIGQIFDVIKGTRLTKANMKTGNIRFIGSSAMNNGCTAMVGNTENMHPANKITVCYNGSVGETFYQDQPFLASDDVNVLYPKFDMTKEIALFIVPLIKTISTKYNYVDKWKQEVMVADEIMLPCTIQQAITQQLVPIYEPLFADDGFGYRPGRSAKDAIRKVKEYG